LNSKVTGKSIIFGLLYLVKMQSFVQISSYIPQNMYFQSGKYLYGFIFYKGGEIEFYWYVVVEKGNTFSCLASLSEPVVSTCTWSNVNSSEVGQLPGKIQKMYNRLRHTVLIKVTFKASNFLLDDTIRRITFVFSCDKQKMTRMSVPIIFSSGTNRTNDRINLANALAMIFKKRKSKLNIEELKRILRAIDPTFVKRFLYFIKQIEVTPVKNKSIESTSQHKVVTRDKIFGFYRTKLRRILNDYVIICAYYDKYQILYRYEIIFPFPPKYSRTMSEFVLDECKENSFMLRIGTNGLVLSSRINNKINHCNINNYNEFINILIVNTLDRCICGDKSYTPLPTNNLKNLFLADRNW